MSDFRPQGQADKSLQAAKSLFSGAGNDENMPSFELEGYTPATLVELLVATQLCASKSEARRLVEQGGVSIDNEKKLNPSEIIEIKDQIVIKKGKKVFLKVIAK